MSWNEKDKPKSKGEGGSGALPPPVLMALDELVPEVLRPSTFHQVQFRAGMFGAYDPPQVDAFLARAAEITTLACGKLFLPDGKRNPEPEMAEIQGLPPLFREARFRRKRSGYRRDDVDIFLERPPVASEELASGLGSAGPSPSRDPSP